MDVSRIEAYNPNKINWRNMTAKDILKYEKKGVEVPDVYLQWAHEFLNNIQKYDNDEVTYEKAKSSLRHENKDKNKNQETSNLSKNEVENKENIELAEIENTKNSQAPNGEPVVKTQTAKEKLEEMKANGDSEYKIAETFKDISIENKQRSDTSTIISEETESNSDNEIQVLDGHMADLMSRIQDVKSQIQNLKGKKDESITGKIAKLNNEIKQLGENGQTDLLGYRNDFDQFDLLINEQFGIGYEAENYGETTINTARKVYDSPTFYMRKSALKAGNNAIKSGETANTSANQANQTNTTNASSGNSYAEKITAETGVSIEHNDNNNIEAEKDPITGKEKEADKAIKTAQNDGTDTTDKLNISLDELVKRKVRRGEYAKDT